MTNVLTVREIEVLDAISNGWKNERIGLELGIKISTVKTHVTNILRKLQVNSKAHAVANAIRQGILPGLPEDQNAT